MCVVNNQDSGLQEWFGDLLCAQDSNSTLIEAVWIFLGGNVKVNSEDEVRPGEVQVHGQSHLQWAEQPNVLRSSLSAAKGK